VLQREDDNSLNREAPKAADIKKPAAGAAGFFIISF
jgi:hypothetical protein